jgi:hypothetical protein
MARDVGPQPSQTKKTGKRKLFSVKTQKLGQNLKAFIFL